MIADWNPWKALRESEALLAEVKTVRAEIRATAADASAAHQARLGELVDVRQALDASRKSLAQQHSESGEQLAAGVRDMLGRMAQSAIFDQDAAELQDAIDVKRKELESARVHATQTRNTHDIIMVQRIKRQLAEMLGQPNLRLVG